MNNIISVIVPVYNVEEYLEKCLNSISIQTYTNFEAILVNDGSSDYSGDICDKYAKKDNRFTVIHRLNGGLSAARNTGLKVAKGQYICFVDSDDWIREELLEKLINLLENLEGDISQCDFFSDENNDFYEKEVIRCYSKDQYMIKLLEDQLPSYFWGKLFKREVFNNQIFPEGKTYEDLLLLPKIINNTKKIIVTNQKYYFYYQSRLDSITNNPSNRVKNQVAIAEALRSRYILAYNYYEKVDDIVLKIAALSSICAFILLGNLKKMDEKSKEEMQANYRFIKEHFSIIKANKKVPVLYKVGASVMLRYSKLFCIVAGAIMGMKNIFRKIKIVK
ncbi:MAG: glycosyltransferase family 2 protein [Eubacteriaceae bacterium]